MGPLRHGVERGVWWQILLVLKRLKAGAQRTLEAVRCSAGVEELPMGSLAPEPRAYGQDLLQKSSWELQVQIVKARQ